MELKCQVQNYDWGKIGSNSIIASLISSANPLTEIDQKIPYAELWMGVHPNGPALIIERNVLLSEYLSDNHDAIGSQVKEEFGATVPFLFKVLSVRKSLSIQAHPDKAHAEILHRENPEFYKDPNHKPELAIALSPFEALCGFRSIEEIREFVECIPELKSLLDPEAVEQLLSEKADSETIKAVFTSLMMQDVEKVANNLYIFIGKLQESDIDTQTKLQYKLLRKIYNEYPTDVGCWSIYLLNYLLLRPGQAIFLGPNMPHAYLSGDCIECMANSDNVVRAGLTSKYIDVPSLVQMLDYKSYTPSQLLFQPNLEDPYSCSWKPPVRDFAVLKIKLPSGSEPYNTIMRNSPSIFIVISGTGIGQDTEPVALKPGVVLFLKANRQLSLTSNDPNTDLILYQAFANVG